MAIPDFTAPSWLSDQDAETIHKRMMELLPADIDKTEGGFPWDFTKPTALEKAEILEFHLIETLKIMFPMWAYGEWLDYHAAWVGLSRKAANRSAGSLAITGLPGTFLPAGFRFAVPVPSSGGSPAIEYETTESAVIGEDGTIAVSIQAVEPGISGNISAGTVSLMVSPIKGITGITNPAPITGGTAVEDDDTLRDRLLATISSADTSFVGSISDYVRWAEEVTGVGTAIIKPEWDGPGTVKVVLLDANGQPANETIIAAVADAILSPDNPTERKAPIGAAVTVAAPEALGITYTFNLEIEAGETQETVISRFADALKVYYVEAKADGVVRYNKVASILTETPGCAEFSNLTMNDTTEKILLEEDEYPVTVGIDPAGGAS